MVLVYFMEEKYQNLKSEKLALFFTYGVGLELWEERGMLGRELKLYKELGKYFKKIYFLTYGRNDFKFAEEFRKYNIEVLHKKSRLPNILYSLFNILYYHRELKQCDYFKTNQMSGSWSAVLSRWFFGKKLVIRTGYRLSLNSREKSPVKYWLARFIEYLAVKNSNKVVVSNPSDEEYFKRKNKNVVLIPNYVDTNNFFPTQTEKNNLVKNLIFVGRLAQEKNLENLILALSSVKNVKLQLIGVGELKDSLAELAKKENVVVEFLGKIDHNKLPEYLRATDLFVFPSLYEGNPKALLEAMACGLPVLATDVRGIKEIVEHKKTGYLTQTDTQDIHLGLKELLANQELRKTIGGNAQKFIKENFSLAEIIKKELDIYE